MAVIIMLMMQGMANWQISLPTGSVVIRMCLAVCLSKCTHSLRSVSEYVPAGKGLHDLEQVEFQIIGFGDIH